MEIREKSDKGKQRKKILYTNIVIKLKSEENFFAMLEISINGTTFLLAYICAHKVSLFALYPLVLHHRKVCLFANAQNLSGNSEVCAELEIFLYVSIRM